MDQWMSTSPKKRWMQPTWLLAAFVVAVVWIGCQPEDVRPGLWLRGESVEAQLDDWRFTDDIEEIFIETRPWYGLPHSTTIWCAELDGKLYVGSYGDQKKAWEKNIARNPEARLQIAGKIYQVKLTPVSDPDLTDALHAAYAQKYDMVEVFGDDIPQWWYYRVAQRSQR
jgi:hypothetical protein